MALNGTYKISTNSQMGKQDAVFNFKTEGDKLTGTNEVMGQTLEILNGKVNGNAFEFNEKMESPMGATEFTFKGKADGDSISGEIQTPMGLMTFEGTRAS